MSDVTPYKRLWAAVFRQGVTDYCTARAGGRHHSTSVHAWFWGDEMKPGKFSWLCVLFDIDPNVARTAVLADWRKHVNRQAIKEIE